MFRVALFFFALLTPNLSYALCNGPSFWDNLTSTQQQGLLDRVAVTPYGVGNVWTATKGNATLTIVGTMHLPDPRHADFFASILPTLEAADLLLVEATLDDQAAMQTYMAQNPDLMTLTDTTLPDQLDAATWDAIRDAAASRGLPGFIAAKMQPWFLAMTLAIPPCAMASMVAGEGGLDNMLIEAAIAREIDVAPLEPWQDVFGLLTSGTFDEQLDALRLSLVDPNLQDSLVVTLVDFYFDEQPAMGWYIAEFTKDYLPAEAAAMFDAQMAEMEQVLLNDRNANWIPVIEEAARIHDDVFIAFGAAHLLGDLGVLNLLDQGGWTLTRR